MIFLQFPCRCCYCHTLPKAGACTARVLCHCVWLCVGGGVPEMLNWKHWQHLFNCKHLSPSHSFMHPVYLLKGALIERGNKAIQTWQLQEMANIGWMCGVCHELPSCNSTSHLEVLLAWLKKNKEKGKAKGCHQEKAASGNPIKTEKNGAVSGSGSSLTYVCNSWCLEPCLAYCRYLDVHVEIEWTNKGVNEKDAHFLIPSVWFQHDLCAGSRDL